MEIIRSFKWIIGPALLSILLLVSCKKDSTSPVTGEPVVQAYLSTGTALTVKVYAQKALTDTAEYGAALTGLKLNVSDGTNTVTLTETAKGVYTYADTSFMAVGKTYSLSFVYNAFNVSAQTTMPAKPKGFATQYSSVTYTTGTLTGSTDTLNRFIWQNPDSLNHVLVFNNLDGISFALNSFGNATANFEVDTKQKSVYYVLPNIFSYYGHYQVMLCSVNQEYINLLKSNASGSNSNNLLNISTNVVNGYGIFTAMQADTLNFDFL